MARKQYDDTSRYQGPSETEKQKQQARRKEIQANNPNPKPARRFAERAIDSYRRQPKLTDAVIGAATRMTPDQFKARYPGEPTTPPQGTADQLADQVGKFGAQIADPLPLLATGLSGGPLGGMVVGGMSEGAKALALDYMRGNKPDYINAIQNAAYGAAGSGVAAKLLPNTAVGNVAEASARVLTGPAIEEAVQAVGGEAGNSFIRQANAAWQSQALPQTAQSPLTNQPAMVPAPSPAPVDRNTKPKTEGPLGSTDPRTETWQQDRYWY